MIKDLIEYEVGVRYKTRGGHDAYVAKEYDVPGIGETMLVGVVVDAGRVVRCQWLTTGHYRICGHDYDLIEKVKT